MFSNGENNQIKIKSKSNHFYCHITTAQVPWWVKFFTAGQDALHSAGVEGSEDSGARSKLPQPSQEEETLMCLLQHCICVSRPCEILGDVNAEELKAVNPLHRCLVDGDGCVFSALSPVIHHQLLGLVDVEWEVVLLTPFCQGTHLLSVGRLIVVGDHQFRS